jgi:hypothetical protein
LERKPEYHSPFHFEDGRIYDIRHIDIRTVDDPTVECCCTVNITERGVEFSFYEFLFYFYPSAFSRGAVSEEHSSQLEAARQWLQRYFQTHRGLMPYSRWGRPIIVDYR